MLVLLVVWGLVGTALGDVSAIMDEILLQTRNALGDNLPFVPLTYQQQTYVPDTKTFRLDEELLGYNGRMELGRFTRTEPPQVTGDIYHTILTTKFDIDLKLTYAQFKATNFTSGNSSKGEMLVWYQKAEMFSIIKIDKTGGTCSSETRSLMPVSFDNPRVDFISDDPQLPVILFANAKYDVNFYLNGTLVHDVWPKFEEVVSGFTSLCSLLV